MPDGLAIRLAYSKSDHDAQCDTVGVPYARAENLCPERSGIAEGPIFPVLI
jgi:hypothetical protein